MANLVPLKSVIVVREGKRVSPPIGKAFPFEGDEVEAMKEGIDYRAAKNEDEEADLASIVAERNSPHVARAKTNGKGAGKTTAMEQGADGAATTEGEEGQTSDSNKAGSAAKPKGKATTAPASTDDDL